MTFLSSEETDQIRSAVNAVKQKADELYVGFPSDLKDSHLRRLLVDLMKKAELRVFDTSSEDEDQSQEQAMQEVVDVFLPLVEEELGLVMSPEDFFSPGEPVVDASTTNSQTEEDEV